MAGTETSIFGSSHPDLSITIRGAGKLKAPCGLPQHIGQVDITLGDNGSMQVRKLSNHLCHHLLQQVLLLAALHIVFAEGRGQRAEVCVGCEQRLGADKGWRHGKGPQPCVQSLRREDNEKSVRSLGQNIQQAQVWSVPWTGWGGCPT